MLTSIRGLTAASLSAGLLLSAAPALASEDSSEVSTDSVSETELSTTLIDAEAVITDATTSQSDIVLTSAAQRASEPVADNANGAAGESGFSFSANVTLATEYRFRGVALTDGEFAIQGGFDVSHSSGFYVGTWGSNLDEQSVGYGSSELDIYGGWSGNLTDALSADIGVIGYLYPDAPVVTGGTDYVEFYGSLSVGFGPGSLTGGVAYAPEQDSLGMTDNLYLYADASVGIPNTPITLNAHVGYTEGFLTFTNDSTAVDYSFGADVALGGNFTASAAYIGVDGDVLVDPTGTFTDDAFVVSISASF